MHPLLTLLFSTACVLLPHVAFAQVHTRHVRSVEPYAQMLLDLGCNRSAFFHSLVNAIEESDVIVYVQTANALPAAVDGRLQFAVAAPGARYLRITVRRDLPINRLIGLIGHELMHAVEIARDRAVVNHATLRALFTRIGHSNDGAAFDTREAVGAGARVLAELSAWRSGTTRRSGRLRR